MADPMRIRAALAGEETTVRVLMSHPMETGLRKDAAGHTEGGRERSDPDWPCENIH